MILDVVFSLILLAVKLSVDPPTYIPPPTTCYFDQQGNLISCE